MWLAGHVSTGRLESEIEVGSASCAFPCPALATGEHSALKTSTLPPPPNWGSILPTCKSMEPGVPGEDGLETRSLLVFSRSETRKCISQSTNPWKPQTQHTSL
jgi:hypothetical protein